MEPVQTDNKSVQPNTPEDNFLEVLNKRADEIRPKDAAEISTDLYVAVHPAYRPIDRALTDGYGFPANEKYRGPLEQTATEIDRHFGELMASDDIDDEAITQLAGLLNDRYGDIVKAYPPKQSSVWVGRGGGSVEFPPSPNELKAFVAVAKRRLNAKALLQRGDLNAETDISWGDHVELIDGDTTRITYFGGIKLIEREYDASGREVAWRELQPKAIHDQTESLGDDKSKLYDTAVFGFDANGAYADNYVLVRCGALVDSYMVNFNSDGTVNSHDPVNFGPVK